MAVGDDHRETASARRANVIRTLRHQLDADSDGSSAMRWKAMLGEPPHRDLIVSGDIDGVVSAFMLGAVTPWRIDALVLGSEKVLLHPRWTVLTDLFLYGSPFGVDVFSTRFPSVSNHPLLWGSRKIGGSAEAAALCARYDADVSLMVEQHASVNPSYWAGIEASVTNTRKPTAASYRYPLGTAQILLALLEAAGKSPRMFDRDYLPWLIANCDGGLETIRAYPFNVPMWWSSMAAAVGPGSISEAIYRTASEQRPNEFVDVDRRLRYEEPELGDLVLDSKWNLRVVDPKALSLLVRWIGDISGWPDPFLDGVDRLVEWKTFVPAGGSMVMSMPAGGVEELALHLDRSRSAIHTSFNFFDQKWRLGWLQEA